MHDCIFPSNMVLLWSENWKLYNWFSKVLTSTFYYLLIRYRTKFDVVIVKVYVFLWLEKEYWYTNDFLAKAIFFITWTLTLIFEKWPLL